MKKNKKKILKEILNKKPCLVFDFDGVIKMSVHVKTKAFIKIYENQSKEIINKIKEYHLKNGGISRFKKFKYFEKNLLQRKPNLSKIKKLSHKFSRIVKDQVIKSKPVPGVINFLKKMKSNNKLIVVNSGTPLEELKEIVYKSNYNKYFDKLYGSPKSKTENLKSLMTDFNISSKNIIFFGDAESDLFAAKGLKISFVGVGNLIKNISVDYKYLLIKDFNELI